VQTTLLGLAIAVILALVTALVGPLLIDWGRFRPVIEAEASRLLGVPVRITGAIEGALLPTPSLTLGGIEIGPADDRRLRARTLNVEFSLGPLIRGEWRAAEMHLIGPEFNLGLDSSGRLAVPKLAIGFDPDVVSIDRLNIEDGHAILTDARNGSRLVLDKLWFNGDVRSLAGPVKGDGAFVIAGELYAYRIAAGRVGDDGTVKLRVNVDPSDRPLAIDTDGVLSFERGEPRFEGAFNIARPAGIALPSGQTFANDPWRLGTRVKATTVSALLEQTEFQYGPEERAVKLTGTAELKFGNKPRFDGVLSARQIDFDRASATADATQRVPLAAIKVLGDAFSGALRPSIPARLGISIDAVTFAGATIQTVRGDLTTDGEAWNLEGFEFRAPGVTQVNLSGRLDVAAQRLEFTGPVSVDSNDPSALVAWLEGVSETPLSRMKPLRARGEVTLSGQKLAIDRLKAEVDRKTVEGRLAYAWATGDRPPRLDADLKAAELDVDALLVFANAARGATTFEMPREVILGIDVGRATIAGVEARQVTARLRRDTKGLQVERFSVADLGGTIFDASGQIDTSSPSPRGTMNLAFDARNLDGVIALAAKLAPESVSSLRRIAERLPAPKLKATLSLESAGAGTKAKLAVEGRSGGVRLSLLGEAVRDSADVEAVDLRAFAGADVRLEGKFEADDGSALVGLLNLDKIIAVDKRPGRLTLAANGSLGGEFRIDSRFLADGLDASANGIMQFGEEGPKGNLHIAVTRADVAPLRRTPAAQVVEPLSVTLTGNLAVAGRSLTFDDFSGTLAGTGLRGRLGFTFAQPLRVEGLIEADAIDAPAALAAAIGMPIQGNARTDMPTWSSEPFAQGFFDDIDGRIEFKTVQAALTPALVLRQARGVAKFSRSEIAFTDVEGTLADGRMTGQLLFNKTAEGLSARGHIGLAEADASALFGNGTQPPLAGRLAVQFDIEGIGLSPLTLVGSLAGNGAVSLEQGQFANLAPKAFDVAVRAVGLGVTVDMAKIGEIVGTALESGRLGVPSVEGVITINAGQVRLANTIAQAEDADLTVAGNMDLIEGTLNARLTLSGHTATPVFSLERPVIFVSLKGPVSAPKRAVDLSALTAWLTLRSIEQQSQRLEAIEGARHESEPGETTPAAARAIPQRAPPSASTGPATSSNVVRGQERQRPEEKPRTSMAAPNVDLAPPLPPPIDIRPVPGALERQPARLPAQAQSGAAARKPPPAKPAIPVPPSARRAPLDLSASPQN
jgi:large subunit ribosomal protein L24